MERRENRGRPHPMLVTVDMVEADINRIHAAMLDGFVSHDHYHRKVDELLTLRDVLVRNQSLYGGA